MKEMEWSSEVLFKAFIVFWLLIGVWSVTRKLLFYYRLVDRVKDSEEKLSLEEVAYNQKSKEHAAKMQADLAIAQARKELRMSIEKEKKEEKEKKGEDGTIDKSA